MNMKIQKGIVKYKDRSDIQCAYGLTDDGKQYYFLDETDTKKFSNGNRIASTALVEAIDPMAKAENVGVIDENGVIVVPFENRSIKPVNDNVIIVEKANPTSQSVLEAIELRNDPAAATKLVSTPATIKDRLNAQMGAQGEYVFNDQFSEATVCDINGSNLVNGESYSFISMANDKLYLSKNTADSPIFEFSLSTYEMLAPTANAIDVSTAVVDTNVVEDALNAQAVAPATEAVAAPVDVQPAVPAAEEVAVPGQEVASPVEAQPAVPVTQEVATPEVPVAEAPATDAVAADGLDPLDVPVADPAAETVTPEVPVAEEGLAALDVSVADAVAAEAATPEVPVAEESAEVEAPVAETPVNQGFDPSEISTSDIPVADASDLPALDEPIGEEVAAPVEEEVAAPVEEAKEETVAEEVEAPVTENPLDNTTPIDPAEVAAAVGATTSVEDDVLASLEDDTPAEEEVTEEETVAEETEAPANEELAPIEDEQNEISDSITESLSALTDEGEDIPPVVGEEETTDTPPIVEEDDLDGFEEIEVDDDKTEEPAAEEETKEETVAEEDETPVAEEEAVAEDETSTEEVKFSDNVASAEGEPVDDASDELEPISDELVEAKNTSATPVPIDAETVLATVDRNRNGIIDMEEKLPRTMGRTSLDELSPLERAYAPEQTYDVPRDTMPTREDYGYLTSGLSSYGTNPYQTPSYGNDYSGILTDVKPDRISYDDFSTPVGGKDNIMADIARSMSELMRQNKEQRGMITQYQERVEGLEAQNRILSEKFKDQVARNENLTSKLRSLDEASARLESRNQLLDSRIHDQEKIIASQDRELKTLRPQIEGKQDLVRLLADARTLLGNETTSYGGYKEEEGYYRRAA